MFLARRLAVLLPAVLVLAGCVAGVPTAPTLVTGGSAILNAQVVATTGSTVTYWFEYGSTAAYGRSTSTKQLSASAEVAYGVYALVPRLAADTTYHLRLCLRESDGAAPTCSADASFATRPPQDSVVARSLLRDAAGIYHPTAGIDLFATARPDGTGASGSVFIGGSTMNGSTADVTCLRVEGDRAAVGTARNVFVVVDAGDGEAGGKRDLLTVLPAPADPSVCPAPVAEPQYSFFDPPGAMITDAP